MSRNFQARVVTRSWCRGKVGRRVPAECFNDGHKYTGARDIGSKVRDAGQCKQG